MPDTRGVPVSAESPAGRREHARKLRSAFLRRYLATGEAERSAAEVGIAHATLYRWGIRHPDFRTRWDSVADQRRFEIEEMMMQEAREGEKTPVFHQGEQVGWRVNRTKPLMAMLAYLDRREKGRMDAERGSLESHFLPLGAAEKAAMMGVDRDAAHVAEHGGATKHDSGDDDVERLADEDFDEDELDDLEDLEDEEPGSDSFDDGEGLGDVEAGHQGGRAGPPGRAVMIPLAGR